MSGCGVIAAPAAAAAARAAGIAAAGGTGIAVGCAADGAGSASAAATAAGAAAAGGIGGIAAGCSANGAGSIAAGARTGAAVGVVGIGCAADGTGVPAARVAAGVSDKARKYDAAIYAVITHKKCPPKKMSEDGLQDILWRGRAIGVRFPRTAAAGRGAASRYRTPHCRRRVPPEFLGP